MKFNGTEINSIKYNGKELSELRMSLNGATPVTVWTSGKVFFWKLIPNTTVSLEGWGQVCQMNSSEKSLNFTTLTSNKTLTTTSTIFGPNYSFDFLYKKDTNKPYFFVSGTNSSLKGDITDGSSLPFLNEADALRTFQLAPTFPDTGLLHKPWKRTFYPKMHTYRKETYANINYWTPDSEGNVKEYKAYYRILTKGSPDFPSTETTCDFYMDVKYKINNKLLMSEIIWNPEQEVFGVVLEGNILATSEDCVTWEEQSTTFTDPSSAAKMFNSIVSGHLGYTKDGVWAIYKIAHGLVGSTYYIWRMACINNVWNIYHEMSVPSDLGSNYALIPTKNKLFIVMQYKGPAEQLVTEIFHKPIQDTYDANPDWRYSSSKFPDKIKISDTRWSINHSGTIDGTSDGLFIVNPDIDSVNNTDYFYLTVNNKTYIAKDSEFYEIIDANTNENIGKTLGVCVKL